MREAIIPAFNEAPTVAAVISVLRAAQVFDRVVVVDDGSSDATATVAARAGADVVRMPKNSGKAQAMLAGLAGTQADPIAFFDADLLGLRPDHVRKLAHLADLGYDMVCGLRDYGPLGNPLHTVMPLITGERFITRRLLAAIPRDCWNGYAIETGMNHAAKMIGARTVLTILPGVQIRTKNMKKGALRGMLGQLDMFGMIGKVQASLDCNGTCSVR